MTEEMNTNDPDLELQEDELEVLKTRATQLGIKFHPAIGVDKLREKVAEFLSSDTKPDPEGDTSAGPVPPVAGAETKAQLRTRQKREASELIRVRVACMNPNKREWEGEVFTVSNAVVGTFKKMVPFDVEYHVPRFILNMIQQRRCQVFTTVKDSRGNKVRRGKLIKEFNVEILPALTEQELKDLAQRQAMANGTQA